LSLEDCIESKFWRLFVIYAMSLQWVKPSLFPLRQAIGIYPSDPIFPSMGNANGATSSTLLPVIARAEDPRSPTNDEAEELAWCLNFAQGIFKTASSASAAGHLMRRALERGRPRPLHFIVAWPER
jgi:hypothetical protein